MRSHSLPVSILLAIAAVASAQAQAVIGTYSAELTADLFKNAPPQMADHMVGSWTLVFKADGTFEVKQNGATHVQGTYVLDGDRLALTDVSGDLACGGSAGSDAPKGVYRVRRDDASLRLEVVADEGCRGRATVLSAKPFDVVK